MQYPLALSATLQAITSKHYEAYVERAKLLWAQGDHANAISELEYVTTGSLKQYSSLKHYLEAKREEIKAKEKTKTGSGVKNGNDLPSDEEDESYLAKCALLQTKWLDASGQGTSSEIRDRYSLIARVHPRWEKVHYQMAKYLSRIHESQLLLDPASRTTESHTGDYITMIIRSYTLSLIYGFKYLYETLPKLITLWLDFSENLTKFDQVLPSKLISKFGGARSENMKSINSFLSRKSNLVPRYIFYIALPQLYSRISHANSAVYEVMQEIIIQVTRMYPRQALWLVLGVQNSFRKERSQRGQEILMRLISTPATTTPQTVSQSVSQAKLRPLVNGASKLVLVLSKLCNADFKGSRGTLSDLGFDTSALPCGLVVPVRECMCITMPTRPDAMKYHTPFPKSNTITIEGIGSHIEVMPSLQRPKKMVLIGSNGTMYKILCKSKDDVRKDARLMELTRSIDYLLKKDDSSYRRRLSIRTYWVTPLSEESGLIEWVDGVRPMKSILQSIYLAHGLTLNWLLVKPKLDTGVDGFYELLGLYKPVLRGWFLETFPEPSAWVEARHQYARTLAVMSMVGFILG